MQEGLGKAPVATPHPGTTPKLQELKMQVGVWGQQL